MTCAHFGGMVHLVAFVTVATLIRHIPEYIGEPAAPLDIAAIRTPPIEAAELDQSNPDSGSEVPRATEYEFDQISQSSQITLVFSPKPTLKSIDLEAVHGPDRSSVVLTP